MGEELFTESPSDTASEPQIPKIIYAIVENKRGVLHRVSSMFRAKGFNISSISIGSTLDPELARMTIVPKGDQASLALRGRNADTRRFDLA
jgi:acetolactate synthase small subunit